MIIIIGAGLAGLVCAKELVAAGRQVLVLEGSDDIGGRVRTDVTGDGYRFDRGFQVLFTAYPAVQRHLNLENLKPRIFDPGAIQVKDGKHYEIADPLRKPGDLVAGLLNPLIPVSDKLRVLRLTQQISGLSTSDIFSGKGEPDGQDESIETYLRRLGFTDEGFIDTFARPFYGGILLKRDLSPSARIFQFTYKMLASGDIIVPAEGMQKIPEQLAAHLPKGALRRNTRVDKLLLDGGKVSGVVLENGERIDAEQAVVATDSPTAAQLTGISLPTQPVSSTYLYFAGETQLYPQRKIVLNANADAFINNAVLITNIAPTYAPPHKHLLSVTLPGSPEGDDEQLARQCRAELAQWYPDADLTRWKLVNTYRIPFSQFAQPPGIYDQLPDNHTAIEGLFLAGEYTKSSSIQGAMHSGEHAAKAILRSKMPV
ncbi:MAG: NAD(P)/FAD-dependent oxidoreductase [Ktedonobacteraceae bacterium]